MRQAQPESGRPIDTAARPRARARLAVWLALAWALVLGAGPLVGCDGDSGGRRGDGSLEPGSRHSRADALAEIADTPLAGHVSNRYEASLEDVLERRFLRVLTSHNTFDYFVHQGKRGGYQYEMVRAFTKFLNRKYARGSGKLPIQFELMPVHDDELIPLLEAGAADLIAARMTVTESRARRVDFSRAYQSIDERLVTHDGTPTILGPGDLSGQTVAVRRNSSYHASLEALNERLVAEDRPPVEIELVNGALETERILELVAARRFPYTVADSMVAELAVQVMPSLRLVENVTLRESGQLAWATLPGAKDLLAEMNLFLARYEEGTLLGNLALQNYFEAQSRWSGRFEAGATEPLSDYDEIFKRHAESYGFDWRLVAAMAFQESRFDADARNRSGAVGLMQIKPSTAREPFVAIPNVTGEKNARHNVEAGLKYLAWIKQRYFDSEPELRERDRLRMALGAYNAGPRTIARARRRARKLGYDPNRWFRNVELALLDMRKSEPVKYVSQINQRFIAYKLLGLD